MIGDPYTAEQEEFLRARLYDLHESGGGSIGMAIPFDDGEIGEVTFQIRNVDGTLKARQSYKEWEKSK